MTVFPESMFRRSATFGDTKTCRGLITGQSFVKRVLAAASLAVLAGCLQAPEPETSKSAPAVGATLIAPEKAAELFAKACIETRPKFAGIENALAGEPFRKNAKSGTLFHQTYNLSFNANADRCSMVFGANPQNKSVTAGLARGTASSVTPASIPRNLDITSRPGPDGLIYFRMVLPG